MSNWALYITNHNRAAYIQSFRVYDVRRAEGGTASKGLFLFGRVGIFPRARPICYNIRVLLCWIALNCLKLHFVSFVFGSGKLHPASRWSSYIQPHTWDLYESPSRSSSDDCYRICLYFAFSSAASESWTCFSNLESPAALRVVQIVLFWGLDHFYKPPVVWLPKEGKMRQFRKERRKRWMRWGNSLQSCREQNNRLLRTVGKRWRLQRVKEDWRPHEIEERRLLNLKSKPQILSS